MGRILSAEDRRLRYGYGLVSDHYIRTGQPLAEKLAIDDARDEEIRSEILASDIWESIQNTKPRKKRGRPRKDRDERDVIFV